MEEYPVLMAKDLRTGLATMVWRDAGVYTVVWDGRDHMERDLASGIYLYRLRAGNRMETRKLLLLR